MWQGYRPIIILILSTIAQVVCVPGPLASVGIAARHKRLSFRETRSNVVLAECSNPPRDSCSFYVDCLEPRYHCGPGGYPLGYGTRYCQKFSDDVGELSAEGQIWMLDTMQCLQNALVPEATGSGAGVTCDLIKEKAFGTHAECYVGSGLCMLPPSDWLAIVHIVQLKTLFENWDAFLATLETAGECLEFYLYLAARASWDGQWNLKGWKGNMTSSGLP